MGMYTGLRVNAKIKPEYLPALETLQHRPFGMTPWWLEVAIEHGDPFHEWAKVGRCDFIPFGSIAYLDWEEDDPEWTHRVEDGRWIFQCTLKNYNDEINTFLNTVLCEIVEPDDPDRVVVSEYEEDEYEGVPPRAHELINGQFTR